MNEVDNKYVDDAIKTLLTTVGVKEHVESKKIESLIRSNKIKEAVREIAKYLGLPIEVNLSYVGEGYRQNATDGFHSTHLVKTDWRGQGTGGITAQVSIPSNLPLYGTPGMVNFPINVRVSENCAKNPATFICIMAHELSHIVLHSIWHKEKENEFYTDLTAIMLGFGHVMRSGRRVETTETENMIIGTMTKTTTTSYGYLSDQNFNFALDKIDKILRTCKEKKRQSTIRMKMIEWRLRRQTIDLFYFRTYLKYLDGNLNQKIPQQDSQWIYSFHQPGYTDEFESSKRNIESEFRQFSSFVNNLNRYNDHGFTEIAKYEERIQSLVANLNPIYDRIRGAVIILKKYVSIWHRVQSFLTIELAMIKSSSIIQPSGARHQ